MLGPRRHQTVSLHDHVYIGGDRQAFPDPDAPGGRGRRPTAWTGFRTSTTRTRSPSSSGQGCAGAPGPLRQIGDAYVDRHPADPLSRPRRDAHPGVLDVLPLRREPRRPGGARVPARGHGHAGELRHADRVRSRALPAAIWWAVWDGVEGSVLEQEVVTLDPSTRCTVTCGPWNGRWSASTGPGERRPAELPRGCSPRRQAGEGHGRAGAADTAGRGRVCIRLCRRVRRTESSHRRRRGGPGRRGRPGPGPGRGHQRRAARHGRAAPRAGRGDAGGQRRGHGRRRSRPGWAAACWTGCGWTTPGSATWPPSWACSPRPRSRPRLTPAGDLPGWPAARRAPGAGRRHRRQLRGPAERHRRCRLTAAQVP